MQGAEQARKNAHNERAWLAWHSATFQRAKHIPPLARLQYRIKAREQTWQEQFAIMEQIAAAQNLGQRKRLERSGNG